jgi:hypothetical protein
VKESFCAVHRQVAQGMSLENNGSIRHEKRHIVQPVLTDFKAGGSLSTGQSLGFLVLVDAIIANTPTGIETSMFAENSTSLLLQNVRFFNVKDSITDVVLSKVLLAGEIGVLVDNRALERLPILMERAFPSIERIYQ